MADKKKPVSSAQMSKGIRLLFLQSKQRVVPKTPPPVTHAGNEWLRAQIRRARGAPPPAGDED
jgi:hypothetical protein